MYKEFYDAGAGIIRLWENWLDRVTPSIVKKSCPESNVFIMSNNPKTGFNGSPESLNYLSNLGADGVLLNDIKMAINYLSSH